MGLGLVSAEALERVELGLVSVHEALERVELGLVSAEALEMLGLYHSICYEVVLVYRLRQNLN